MAIQHRRGNYADFDPTKMVAGEPAVVLGGDPTSSDGKAAYIAFGPGSVKKLATAEDMRDEIYNQTQSIIQEIEEGVADDVEQAESAAQRAETAAAQFEIDATLTQQGKAADAKKVGDEISDIKADLSEIVPGLSDKAKEALLACFRGIAWLNWKEEGEVLYNALEEALYESSPSGGIVYQLTNESFMRGYTPKADAPDYYSADAGRLGYMAFDLRLTTGKEYRFKVDSPYSQSLQVGYQFYNDIILNAVANGETWDWVNSADFGWQESDVILPLPRLRNGSNIRGVRITVRQNPQQPDISDDFIINSLTIERLSGDTYKNLLYMYTNNTFRRKRELTDLNTGTYMKTNNSILCYNYLATIFDGGKKYRFQVLTTYETAQMRLSFFTEKMLANYRNSLDLTADGGSGYVTEWLSLDEVIDVPALGADGTAICGMRLEFRQSSSAPTISDDFLITRFYIWEVE